MAKKRAHHTPDTPSPKPPKRAKGTQQKKPRAKRAGVSPALVTPPPKEPLLLAAPKRSRGAEILAATRALHGKSRAELARLRAHGAKVLHASWESSKPVLRRIGEGLAFLGVAVAGLLMLFLGYSYAISYRVLPNTAVGGVAIGGMKPEDALQLLQARVASYEQVGLTLRVDGTAHLLHPQEDLGVAFQPEAVVGAIVEQQLRGAFLAQQQARFTALFTATDHALPMTFDSEGVASRIRGRIPALAEVPVEPEVRWDGTAFVMTPGRSARTADMDAIIGQMRSASATLSPIEIAVTRAELAPSVSDAAATAASETALALLAHPIELAYRDGARGGPWTIDLKKDPTWLTFIPEEGTMRIGLASDRLETYLRETVAAAVNQEHADATVKHTDPASWRVEVTGEARDGHTLHVEESASALQEVIAHAAGDAPVRAELLATYEPGLVLGENGEDLGLRDLLAHARSNFAASPSGRDFNVRKGMKIYNGLLIPKDAAFSFNSFLGPVDAAHGWKDALTIFQGGLDTRMESGGGICQVSTTVYQAAVKAGLKVTVRRAHSYFVSYYAKAPGLNGIDATIFPGSQDLEFINDTPGPILMLAGSEGTIAYVQIFGTKDRSVALDGPYVSKSYGPGAPILKDDPSLAAGQTVIDKQGHSGHSVTWYQTITKDDGTSEKITIYSGYKAIPSQGRRGPDGGTAPVAVEGSVPAGG